MRRHPLKHVRSMRRAIRARHAAVQAPPLAQVQPTPIAGVKPMEKKHTLAEDLHDWILGGQDGLVNVLGSILGVAVVTSNKYIIIVAGLAAVCAESISMAAVAYTSVKASRLYYESERERLAQAIEENPVLQREILIDLYERKGLTRAEATRVITELTKDKKLWVDSLMEEHLRLYTPEDEAPTRSAFIVGFSALLGSIIPMIPFFFLIGAPAIWVSCIGSLVILFFAGALSAKLTIGDWKARGIEMACIGMTAALVSFAIGFAFTKAVGAG
jgi:vacuolar iron transporter family protein